MGEFGKPFNNELFVKKDYSKELNSGYFIQNDHLKIFNCRNIFHQFSIHRDYWKINSWMSEEWHNHWESCCHNWNTSGTDNHVGTSDDFESNGRFRIVFLRWLIPSLGIKAPIYSKQASAERRRPRRPGFPNSLFPSWDSWFVSRCLLKHENNGRNWTSADDYKDGNEGLKDLGQRGLR